jgi:hypothetical protein
VVLVLVVVPDMLAEAALAQVSTTRLPYIRVPDKSLAIVVFIVRYMLYLRRRALKF